MRISALFAAAIAWAALIIAPPAWLLAQQRPGKGRARAKVSVVAPPKWDQSTLDAFYSDAREHLGPGPAPTGAAASPVASPGPGATPAVGQPAQQNDVHAGPQWSKLISPGSLEDEVKAKLQTLVAAIATPTAFKGGGYKAAREDFSVLAAVFGVIAQYDGPVRWRKDAVGLRAAYARAGVNCKVGTDNSFQEAKLRGQDLTELVRGGNVPVATADAEAKWSDVSNRQPLMKRMELAQRERLGPWTANAGEFGRNRDAIVREAQMLAMIAEVIKDQSYEYADDSTYRAYVDELQQHSLEIIEATKGNDFPKAQAASSGVNKACASCHGDFRS